MHDPPNPEPRAEEARAAEHPVSDVEYGLRSEVARWAGTPHVLGGTTIDGVDCSAFVQNVFQRALNIELPRTTDEQVHIGTAVQRRDLRAGDLVFFRPPTKTRHVGIYLSDGEFAHASSSRGVTVSELDQAYWDESYWTSRRILPESARPTVADRTRVVGSRPLPAQTARESSDASKRGRIGW